MTQIVIATHNPHKTREFAQLLGPSFAVSDLIAGHTQLPVTEETGATYQENAALKALEASRLLPQLVIADDSGLEVDALDGAPGVRSARYAGPDADGHRNVEKLLAALAFVARQPEKRTARFVCAIVAARDGILLGTFEGRLEGVITATPRGSGGFGYDCVFQPLGRDGTLAELLADEKNRLSHRAAAAAHFTQALARNGWT